MLPLSILIQVASHAPKSTPSPSDLYIGQLPVLMMYQATGSRAPEDVRTSKIGKLKLVQHRGPGRPIIINSEREDTLIVPQGLLLADLEQRHFGVENDHPLTGTPLCGLSTF